MLIVFKIEYNFLNNYKNMKKTKKNFYPNSFLIFFNKFSVYIELNFMHNNVHKCSFSEPIFN